MFTMGATKDGEIRRTLEVCRNILRREGINERGMYFLVAFLRDTGRSLDDVMLVALEEMQSKTNRQKLANRRN